MKAFFEFPSGDRQALRPSMLMVSRCLPQADGPPERARAWQLLRFAGRSHRVFLACLYDGPLTLAIWRNARALTERMVIEASRGGRRAMAKTVEAWRRDQTFAVALSTSPELWPIVQDIGAKQLICDFAGPKRTSGGWLRQLRAPRSREQERAIAAACDVVILPDESHELNAVSSGQVLVLPLGATRPDCPRTDLLLPITPPPLARAA